MATSYRAPDIYIEEISTGPRPIGAVGTSTAAFLGLAPNPDAHSGDPVAVNNWSEFLREFAPPNPKDVSTVLSNAVFGFFLNGGSRCYVVNLGKEGRLADALAKLEAYEEVAIVAAPGYTDAASYDALLTHCEKLMDRVAVFDSPRDVTKIDLITKVAVVGGGPAAAPAAEGGAGEGGGAGGGRAARAARAAAAAGAEGGGARSRNSDGGYAAQYHPWIIGVDPLSTKADPMVAMPPSGHMAGIWARTDAKRGVHKAPANELVKGALGLTSLVTRSDQEVLNPAGINCIRFFPAEGIKVWGARTVAPEASEWRYLNVRRLFNMIEESIARGTRWVVFEPNDEELWGSIKRDVGAFLRMVWRDGALMGRTPQEAFFVQCDAETNPPESIDQGRVVIVIGIAPVKPAEFIIFRIGQYAGGVEIEV
jgi:phage tail sheath protein FI